MRGLAMFSILNRQSSPSEILNSSLLNEDTFYGTFIKDLDKCGGEVIIESPFITHRRISQLMPALKKLKERKVRVVINTRNPQEHEEKYAREDALDSLASLQRIGVQVVYTDSHHRKLAILDRSILYEGSLNILSQNNSREVMRRIESVRLAWQMARFVEIDRFLS
jgi:phosphatidylserine/phosphatidylglycerophosphate/cardiolipin synthase-like enzyme